MFFGNSIFDESAFSGWILQISILAQEEPINISLLSALTASDFTGYDDTLNNSDPLLISHICTSPSLSPLTSN